MMQLDVLHAIVQELKPVLTGRFVGRIHQPLAREVVLRLRAPGQGETKLMMSADLRLGRIHLTSLTIPNPPVPPRFSALLRAHVSGSRVAEISCRPDDRVVWLITHRARGAEQKALILELLGRDSNLVLVELPGLRIIDCLHRIPEGENTTRPVLAGMVYQPPPKRTVDPAAEVIGLARSGTPGLTRPPGGRPALTLTAVPGRDEVCASVNEAADKLYKEILSREMMAQMRRWISAPVKARIRSLKRRAAKIGEDLRKARQRAERQEEGELLKGNLHRAQKGLAEIRVQDWTTGASRTIRLDPRLDAVANMEKIFRDAGKGKRGMAKAEERLHETEDECRGLEDLLYCIEAAEDLATLESLGHELEGVRRKAGPGKSKERPRKHREQRQVSPGTPYRALWTPEGRRLWVGKTGRGNDLLVKEKARSGDLWFHVKDRPGAHVVLAVRGKESPGPEEEEFAARVAAHFSKARGRGKVEVMVAHAEQVHRPNNAMPGQVHVSSYRTLLVESMDPFTGPE